MVTHSSGAPKPINPYSTGEWDKRWTILIKRIKAINRTLVWRSGTVVQMRHPDGPVYDTATILVLVLTRTATCSFLFLWFFPHFFFRLLAGCRYLSFGINRGRLARRWSLRAREAKHRDFRRSGRLKPAEIATPAKGYGLPKVLGKFFRVFLGRACADSSTIFSRPHPYATPILQVYFPYTHSSYALVV